MASWVEYCECETPLIDIEHDAGCRRCGLPVYFAVDVLGGPSVVERVAMSDDSPGLHLKPGERIIAGERFYSAAWL